MSAISPKPSPRRRDRNCAPVTNDLDLAVGDHVEAVAFVSLANDFDSRGHRARLEGAGERLERRRRERSEQRHRAQERDLHHRNRGVAVDVEQPAPGCEGDEREDRADADEGERHAAEPDEERRQDRADGERPHQEPFEQPEDTREKVGPRDALEQRAPGDVERHPGAARDPEQDERAKRTRQRREPHERDAPDRQREDERDGKPGQPDEVAP